MPRPTALHNVVTQPDFSGEPQPISELVARNDFPQGALGVYIDIRGFAGVVVEIVNQSIKVRSPDGVTQRFNANRLKTLYAPPDRSEPVFPTHNTDRLRHDEPSDPTPTVPSAPPRVYIANPDFTSPAKPINDFTRQPDFPTCAYAQHVDIFGYTGVVVEIVKGSLKVQTPAGTSRSYNGEVLKKLYS